MLLSSDDGLLDFSGLAFLKVTENEDTDLFFLYQHAF